MQQQKLAAALAILGSAAAARIAGGQPAVVYVDQRAPSGGDGASWGTAYRDLEAALAATRLGFYSTDLEFRIAQGVYRPSVGGSRRFEFDAPVASSAVTIAIRGSFAGLAGPDPDARDFATTPTVLSGDINGDDGPGFANRSDNSGAVVAIGVTRRPENPGVRLSGVTVRGGEARGWSSPSSEWAGAMNLAGANGASGIIIEDCAFEGNRGYFGGALFIATSNTPVEIRSTRFVDNAASSGGGGVGIIGDRVVFDSCSFIENAAGSEGGAILHLANRSGTPRPVEVRASRFLGNTAGYRGGAIRADTGDSLPIVIESCLMSGNSAMHGGGASLNAARVVGCSIAGNRAGGSGGGLHLNRVGLVVDCIIADNAAMQGRQIQSGDSGNRIENSLVRGGSAGIGGSAPVIAGLIDANPRFVSPSGADGDPLTWSDNDLRLRPGSPGIDRGDQGSLIALGFVDVGGLMRRVAAGGGGSRMDWGAHELQSRDCAADSDLDGGITIEDLLEYLGAFERGELVADLDGAAGLADGAVTIEDLMTFLARYEAGC